jgi:hypothetical protein
MFEVGGSYANRRGRYTVLEINEPKMTVQYDNGDTAELNMNIQYRIWENILADEELMANRVNRSKKRVNTQDTNFFVRPVNSLTAESLTERGWKEQVTEQELEDLKIGKGDRLIYYAIESQVYFAVGTITGEPTKPTARDKKAGKGLEDSVMMLPVEVEARAWKTESAVSVDGMEIESQPDIKDLLNVGDTFVSVAEDDFELLAEALTEATEEEDQDEVEIDDEDDYED